MVYLEPDQAEVLKRLAVAENASETEIVRRALAAYEIARADDPLAALIGAFKGGPRDGARNHDKYLVEAFASKKSLR